VEQRARARDGGARARDGVEAWRGGATGVRRRGGVAGDSGGGAMKAAAD
jgi:hypothetical protein